MSALDRVRETLAAHEIVGSGVEHLRHGREYDVCSCGSRHPRYDEGRWSTHRAHVAEALLPVLAEMQAEALRDAAKAVRRMADQAEVDAGGKLDRWDAFAEAEDLLLYRADQIGADQ